MARAGHPRRLVRRGDELVINFDCTQATESIPAWAAAAGHPVTDYHKVGSAGWTITVLKAS